VVRPREPTFALTKEHVRFGSKADISECLSDVCFAPKSGHRSARS
jgi:hypothetical protein